MTTDIDKNKADIAARAPKSATPDPENPGWWHWSDFRPGSFASRTGRLIFRPLHEVGHAQVRMFPDETMLNMGGSMYGGAVMSFIDLALFAGGRCCSMPEGHYVTLDCSTHFIARTRVGTPLDAFVRLVGVTPGGMVHLSGHCEQDGKATHSFTGTLKKVREPRGDDDRG
ncbi:PaaI family thioesterase [Sphingomicrobium nitratireducens]|uniref:PaaI family thioesterase n=1 Tax=Sphingomicrobium nitratireducens TaxID=2964666 RepID=UPI00223FB9C9|nr:PaaI family thioesterase [Sphingomicrobium nitratireducens]